MALQRTQSLTTTKIASGQAENHIGMKGELTVSENTVDNTVDLRLHDGITAGGTLLKSYEVKEGWAEVQAAANQNSGSPPVSLPVVTGGTETTYTDSSGQNWKVHTFTDDGSFTVENTDQLGIEYLIVAGGGGGGDSYGAGGGAGGVKQGSINAQSQTYSIVIGEGGVAQTKGGDSSAFSQTVIGGGAGGTGNNGSGGDGGSGGGGAGNNYRTIDAAQSNWGNETTGQGNRGGGGNRTRNGDWGGGGGGYSSVGGNADASATNNGAVGGTGLQSDISGTSLWYAAGGAGRKNPTSTNGIGGSSPGAVATVGTANRGAGGAAGDSGNFSGTDGVVIVRYKVDENGQVKKPISPTATGGTESTYTDDSGREWKIHTFTSDGTFSVTSEGEIDYLIVGGGGGGGFDVGGGGGAGGYLAGVNHSLAQGTYTVTVGDGGAGGTANASFPSKGGNSSLGTDLVAYGGGEAGNWNNNNPGKDGGSGGSGGGGGGHMQVGYGGDPLEPAQGFAGGDATHNAPGATGGGGGGAGGAGENGKSNSTTSFAAGGPGLSNDITGTSVVYAAGGNGAGDGWTGGDFSVPNTGNGGHGSGANADSSLHNIGYAGGSGIVVVRYRA